MVLSVLHDIEGFASADEIYERVQGISSSVDISTIYRTLELLQDLRLVASVELGDGQRRYELQGLHGHPFHLVCLSCGAIIGVEPQAIEAFSVKMKEEYTFEIDLDHLSVPRLCHQCSGGS